MTKWRANRNRFINMIENERDRQDEKHPVGMYLDGVPSLFMGMAVLTEEVGELSKAIIEMDRENQIEEAVQVAAVALRMLEEVI